MIAEDLVQAGASISIANKYGEVPIDKCRGAMAKKLHSKIEVYIDILFMFMICVFQISMFVIQYFAEYEIN